MIVYRGVASQSSRLGRREEISIILPPELVSERKIPLTEKGIFLPQVTLATKIPFAVQPFQMKFASRISFGERSDKLQSAAAGSSFLRSSSQLQPPSCRRGTKPSGLSCYLLGGKEISIIHPRDVVYEKLERMFKLYT